MIHFTDFIRFFGGLMRLTSAAVLAEYLHFVWLVKKVLIVQKISDLFLEILNFVAYDKIRSSEQGWPVSKGDQST